MEPVQDWQTEEYKGMEVHVCALARDESHSRWHFTVRVTQPGDDAGSASELTAQSGDEHAYPTAQAAVAAGFERGYALVDELLQ